MVSPSSLLRLDAKIVPQRYRLSLRIDPESDQFSGIAEIDVMLEAAERRIVLHAARIDFERVEIRSGAQRLNATIEFLTDDGTIAVDVVETIGPGLITLSFAYTAPLAAGLEGIYKITDDGKVAVFTQFEAIGARRAFPCFDEPGFKSTFEIELVVPRGFHAISNSLEIAKTKSPGGFVTHQFATTKPLPTYLIMLAVGKFDVVEAKPIPANALRSTPIPLRGIAMRGKGKQMNMALRYTTPLVLAEEAYFGIAYPFDKLDVIAVPDFGAGGMENAGAITYDENYVLMDNSAGIDDRRDFLSLHAHEIAHHWLGNLVSPKWWDDLWLNEAFASFMESKFAHMIEPDWQFDTDILFNAHEAMIADQAKSVRRVHEPVTSVDGISAAFDAITYQKGAALLAQVEYCLGAADFRNFVRRFLKARRFGTMDTTSFMNGLARQKDAVVVAEILQEQISVQGVRVMPKAVLDNLPRYQVFDITRDEWNSLFAKVKHLGRAEALTVAINLDVAFFAQRIDFELYLQGVAAISIHPDWQVAGFPLERLKFLAASSSEIARVAMRVIKTNYAARLRKIGLTKNFAGKTVSTWQKQSQRDDLLDVFTQTGADPELQAKLSAKGLAIAKRKRISVDDNKIAPSDVSSGALIAAAILEGDDFLNLALGHFKNKASLSDRATWLDVIAASHANSSSLVIEELLLSDSIRNQEIPDLLFARAEAVPFQDALWDIVDRNALALLKRLDGDMDVTLIQLADVFATEELAQKVEATIKPLLGELRGGEVQLHQTLEHIRANAALLALALGSIA